MKLVIRHPNMVMATLEPYVKDTIKPGKICTINFEMHIPGSRCFRRDISANSKPPVRLMNGFCNGTPGQLRSHK